MGLDWDHQSTCWSPWSHTWEIGNVHLEPSWATKGFGSIHVDPHFRRAPSSSGATYHTTLLMWVGSESSGRGLTRKQHLWRFSKLTQHSDDHQQELKLWSLGVDFTCTGEIHVIHYFFPFQVRCDSLFCGCVPPNDVPRSRHLFSLHCCFGWPTGIQQSCYFLFFFNFLY